VHTSDFTELETKSTPLPSNLPTVHSVRCGRVGAPRHGDRLRAGVLAKPAVSDRHRRQSGLHRGRRGQRGLRDGVLQRAGLHRLHRRRLTGALRCGQPRGRTTRLGGRAVQYVS